MPAEHVCICHRTHGVDTVGKVIRDKPRDFEERYGITFAVVNPAYSSQSCTACGRDAKANRKSRSEFSCRAWSHEINANRNAARNLESGRSALDLAVRNTKAESLRLTVLRHLEREKTRGRVNFAKVLDSPYYRTVVTALDRPLIRKSPLQHVVAAVSAGESPQAQSACA